MCVYFQWSWLCQMLRLLTPNNNLLYGDLDPIEKEDQKVSVWRPKYHLYFYKSLYLWATLNLRSSSLNHTTGLDWAGFSVATLGGSFKIGGMEEQIGTCVSWNSSTPRRPEAVSVLLTYNSPFKLVIRWKVREGIETGQCCYRQWTSSPGEKY